VGTYHPPEDPTAGVIPPPKKKLAAADVLSRLEGRAVVAEPVTPVPGLFDGTSGRKLTTLGDALQTVGAEPIDQDFVERFLDQIGVARFPCNPSALTDLLENMDGLSYAWDPIAVLMHPAVRIAAAERGLLFYVNHVGHVEVAELREPDKPPTVIDVPKIEVVETVPEPDFYLKPEWYEDLASFVERGIPVLLIGPAGSGKSESVERIFRERGQSLQIVSCTPRMRADDLEGAVDLVIEEGIQVTRFTPAAPAIASKEGHGLLLDEADAPPPEAMYGLYRLLDGKPMHVLRKGHDGIVPLHPEFRVVGTQNTEGRGDDRGLYHGRGYQDEAFLDRWENTIRVEYPPKDHEVIILRKRTGIPGTAAERIVETATICRRALESDDLMFTCSLRRTLAVARNIAKQLTPEKAWRFACQNRAIPTDAAAIDGFLNRIYGSKLRRKVM
jgi:cobaltochelatase CobS